MGLQKRFERHFCVVKCVADFGLTLEEDDSFRVTNKLSSTGGQKRRGLQFSEIKDPYFS